MPTDSDLLDTPEARSLLSAGVPAAEVLAGLKQQTAEAAPTLLRRRSSNLGEAPLPAGWEERFDPATGRRYYVDFNTQSTSWTRPNEAASSGKKTPKEMSAGLVPSGRSGSFRSSNRGSARQEARGGLDPDAAAALAVAEAAEAAEAASRGPTPTKKGKGAVHKMNKELRKLGVFGAAQGGDSGSRASPSPSPSPSISPPPPTGPPVRNFPSAAAALATDKSSPQGMLALLRNERTPPAEREEVAQGLRAYCATAPASDPTPLRLLDALGSSSQPRVQQPLCDALASAGEAHHAPLLESGAVLYAAPLLSSPIEGVQRAALRLLLALCSGDCAAQVAGVGAAPTLLGLLSSAAPAESRSIALRLISELLSSAQGARALLAAGAAETLCVALIHASGVAKGWGGGDAARGKEEARLTIDCLCSVNSTDPAAVQRAVRNTSAMPSIVALTGTDDERARSSAMMLLSSLAPQNAGEVVASGGIAMLCETLSRGATDQTLHTLAQLSQSAVHAVAIAQQPGALATLCSLVGQPHVRELAISVLSNLCALGALPTDALAGPDDLHRLVAPLLQGGLPPSQRAGLLSLLSRAALEGPGRQALAAVGAPPLLVAAADSGDANEAVHGLQALAHLAADERFRSQLSGWGALRPLCHSLDPARALDPRARAVALSAVANVSFVEPAALLEAGAAPRLCALLGESEPHLLRMALTAIVNLSADPAAVPHHCIADMLAAGAPAAAVRLLDYFDLEIRTAAAGAVAALARLPLFAEGLAAAGGGASLARLLGQTALADEPRVHAIASAMTPLLVDEASRGAARAADGVAALSGALQAIGSSDTRLALLVALDALVGGDWGLAYTEAGWAPLIGALSQSSKAIVLAAARAAAATLETPGGRDSLANGRDLLLVCATLWALSREHASLAAGASAAHVALLRRPAGLEADGEGGLLAPALALLVEVADEPRFTGRLAAAGALPALLPLLQGEHEHALVVARSLSPLLKDDAAREAACTTANVRAVAAALLAAEREEARLALSLALVELVDGDFGRVHAAGGWPAVVAALAAAASTASPQMASLASGAFEPLVSFLPAEASALSKAPTQPASPSALVDALALHEAATAQLLPEPLKPVARESPGGMMAADLD